MFNIYYQNRKKRDRGKVRLSDAPITSFLQFLPPMLGKKEKEKGKYLFP
jgi:hypothetical protein